MDPLGMHSETVVRRARETGHVGAIPSLSWSLLIGGLGFLIASLVVFATVAFGERWMYANLGVGGAYLVWTVLFIVLAGVLMSPLVLGPGNVARFFVVFTLAFLLYSIGWMAAYFVLGDLSGEIAGALAGTALMALAICFVFGRMTKVIQVFLILFIGNSLGYFAGRELHATVNGRAGMLLWGACFGLGLGIALGRVFHDVQSQIREQLKDPFATRI
jgi:hypothetical protein